MRERNLLGIQLGHASLDILTFGSQRPFPRRGKPTVPENMRGTLTSSDSDSMHTSTFTILLYRLTVTTPSVLATHRGLHKSDIFSQSEASITSLAENLTPSIFNRYVSFYVCICSSHLIAANILSH